MSREPIDVAALRSALDSRWARIEVVDEIDSTNAALLRDPVAPDRAVLVAETQSSGRGRLDRAWSSPRGTGLTFSMLVRPSAPVATWGWLPLLTGVALLEGVRPTGVAVALKWPNDVLHAPSERKLAGVLAQRSGGAVVIGVGLNVSTAEDELPVPTASSLTLCGASDPDRAVVLAAILTRMGEWLTRWSAADGDARRCGLASAYEQSCATLGREVVVSMTDTTTVRGTARSIDRDGRLRIEAGGRLVTVAAGDVRHLRPSGFAG